MPPASHLGWILLALGDPQLEGDSSLPAATGGNSSPTRLEGGLRSLRALRKSVDLLGNDYYLAHIFRTLHWWTRPTHVTVLGDLLGSQWISDDEFDRRGHRFWNRVFRGAVQAPEEAKETETKEGGFSRDGENGKRLEVMHGWSQRAINVAGNHDVGYAGDMTTARMTRFERTFGPANAEWWFDFPSAPRAKGSSGEGLQLRIVVLNSLNLDGPVVDRDLQAQTYHFLNRIILGSKPVESRKVATIVLTHLPLHKEAGVCVDEPLIAYHDAADAAAQAQAPAHAGTIKEQNHLSYDSSRGAFLEGIFGMSGDPAAPGAGLGRPGIILTGHDHEGCDVYHHLPPAPPLAPDAAPTEARRWSVTRWHNVSHALLRDRAVPGIREITVRSMMGAFGGNAGLLSVWHEPEHDRWRFEFATCALGLQHLWWAVHVLDLVTVLAAVMVCGAGALSAAGYGTARPARAPVPVRPSPDQKRPVPEPAVVRSALDDGWPLAVSGVDAHVGRRARDDAEMTRRVR
ncbi:MAG: hypothetical protein M1826_002852 [Phylliscum demangeonii]|nr:MAG: hypothetical protein M1826_002852 [Phylliscum demangeonii]